MNWAAVAVGRVEDCVWPEVWLPRMDTLSDTADPGDEDLWDGEGLLWNPDCTGDCTSRGCVAFRIVETRGS